jgi:N-acetylglucosaminyldiphosphoundecaprenol N-acetyl-beta-D-mannosaminyltransferase
MLPDKIQSINIFGVNINRLTYKKFLDCVTVNINNNGSLTIGYANADTLNKSYDEPALKNTFNSFDLIHPDGVGVYLASKFLYGNNGLEKRITGSDFYRLLIDESVKRKWRYFFFGHDENTLKRIKGIHPSLNICGIQDGYRFETREVIKKINESQPDIIIIGLSTPVQENWISENKEKLNYKVILTVGEGIKVFSGEKIRGPVFLRKIGLEWLVRYIMSPVSNFKKYIIGVPLFIARVFREKLKSN